MWNAKGDYETFTNPTTSSASYLAFLRNQTYQWPAWTPNMLPRVVSTLAASGRVTNVATTTDIAMGDTIRGTCSVDSTTIFATAHGMPMIVPDGPNAGAPATAAEGSTGAVGDSLVAYIAGHKTRVTSSTGYTLGKSAVIINSTFFDVPTAAISNTRTCHITNAFTGGGSTAPLMVVNFKANAGFALFIVAPANGPTNTILPSTGGGFNNLGNGDIVVASSCSGNPVAGLNGTCVPTMAGAMGTLANSAVTQTWTATPLFYNKTRALARGKVWYNNFAVMNDGFTVFAANPQFNNNKGSNPLADTFPQFPRYGLMKWSAADGMGFKFVKGYLNVSMYDMEMVTCGTAAGSDTLIIGSWYDYYGKCGSGVVLFSVNTEMWTPLVQYPGGSQSFQPRGVTFTPGTPVGAANPICRYANPAAGAANWYTASDMTSVCAAATPAGWTVRQPRCGERDVPTFPASFQTPPVAPVTPKASGAAAGAAVAAASAAVAAAAVAAALRA